MLQIPIPFETQQPVGLGDVIKRITDFLHIPQCGGCQERQEFLNQRVEFQGPVRWED
jgi:hypothetical protein